MRPHRVDLSLLVLLPFLVLTLSGCGEEISWPLEVDTLSPGRSELEEPGLDRRTNGLGDPSQPFDLHVGNRWEYDRTVTAYLLEEGDPPEDPFVLRPK